MGLRRQRSEIDWKVDSPGGLTLTRNDQSFVTCETEISTLMTLQESEVNSSQERDDFDETQETVTKRPLMYYYK